MRGNLFRNYKMMIEQISKENTSLLNKVHDLKTETEGLKRTITNLEGMTELSLGIGGSVLIAGFFAMLTGKAF